MATEASADRILLGSPRRRQRRPPPEELLPPAPPVYELRLSSAPLTAEEVEHNLRVAADTMTRLGEQGPSTALAQHQWSAPDEAATAYGYTPVGRPRPRPSNADITHMDAVLAWLAHVPDERGVARRILALMIRWNFEKQRYLFGPAKVARLVGCDRRAVLGWYAGALAAVWRAVRKMPSTRDFPLYREVPGGDK